jgi:tRNA 2-thiouridine synthesizing protein A
VSGPSRLDIRSYACPFTWVKTRIALERMREGESLEVLVAEGEPLENLPRSAEEEGHRVAAREPFADGGWRLLLVKGRAAAAAPWEA